MLTIPLKSTKYPGLCAYVDDVDYAQLVTYTWHPTPRRGIMYARAYINGMHVYMHRYILGSVAGEIIDHKDRNGLNNVRTNLRTATRSGNASNGNKRRGSSKYKGVTWHRTTWRAQIMKDNKHIHLGMFSSELEAAQAYDKAAKELHGEYSRLNFPEGVLCS